MEKKIIILVASNFQVRYEVKLEAMIQPFGGCTETEVLLISAAAQLCICGRLWSRRPHAALTACIFWYGTADHTLMLCLPLQSC